MEQLKVRVEPMAAGKKETNAKFGYRILSDGNHGYPDGYHLKSCYVKYIADMIRDHGIIFYDRPKPKTFSALEKAKLSEYHYRQLAEEACLSKGQNKMAESLVDATVTHRKIDYDGQERFYSVIFSNKLQVRVNDLHWRMFDIKPLLNKKVSAVQKELVL